MKMYRVARVHMVTLFLAMILFGEKMELTLSNGARVFINIQNVLFIKSRVGGTHVIMGDMVIIEVIDSYEYVKHLMGKS